MSLSMSETSMPTDFIPSMKDSPDFSWGSDWADGSASVDFDAFADGLSAGLAFGAGAWSGCRGENKILSTRSAAAGCDTPQRREAAMRAAPKQTKLAPRPAVRFSAAWRKPKMREM